MIATIVNPSVQTAQWFFVISAVVFFLALIAAISSAPRTRSTDVVILALAAFVLLSLGFLWS